MVTVADDTGKQTLPLDTHDQKVVPENEAHSTPVDPKSAQHNFRSMADLLRNQAAHDDVTSRDLTPIRGEKSDENENSVQDLRLNGQRSCSSMALREEHLRRWYSGDLGGSSGADGSFMVDVDGQSSHSGIPSDLSSEGDHNDLPNMNDDFDMLENEEEHMDADKNDNNHETALKISSQSDGDNVSEADHDMRKSKRKQYTPKQRDSVRTPGSEEQPNKVRKTNNFTLQEQLNFMQRQLLEMQSKVLNIDQVDSSEANKFKPELSTPSCFNFSKENGHFKGMQNQQHLLSPLGVKINMNRNTLENKSSEYKNIMHTSPIQGDTPKDLEDLTKTLKNELTAQVGTMVDTIMAKYAESRKKIMDSPKEKSPTPVQPSRERLPVHTPVTTQHTPVSDRPIFNLSPRIPTSEMMQRHHHTNTILNNMSKLPFPFNKPKQDMMDKSLIHDNKVEVPKPQKPMKFNEKLMTPYFDPSRAFGDFPRPSPWFPHLPFYPPAQVPTHPLHAAFGGPLKEQEQTEALPLVVNSPKKKRTKVTDTRLSPRAARALLQEPVPAEQPMMQPGMSPLGDRKEIPMPATSFHTPLIPASLPTSVAIPNPSLQHSDVFGLYGPKAEHLFHRADFHSFATPSNRSPPVRDDSRSPIYTPSDSPSMFKDTSSLMGDQDMCTPDGMPQTSTLTPMHLRKAKLMFFYVRYPSSSIIKVFFPDVRFNKNNTAQLVKWFSNFREFYYIQMEKYARQAVAEGVKNPEDLVVTTDSELYRVLNLHYNRNNQLEVPEGFRIAVQATLREFYKAVSLAKDTEQSWKKPIYKVIARMDDAVPDYFKSPNWMEQLNDL